MTRRWNAGSRDRMVYALGALAIAFVWTACAGGSGSSAPTLSSESAEQQTPGVRLDRDKLAGIGLEEYPPMSAEGVLEGGNGQRGHTFFTSEEIVVEIWAADASILAITEPFPFDEFVTVLSGKLVLTDREGTVAEYSSGESLVVPKGFTGTWQMIGNYRELVVIESEAYEREYGD